MNKIVAVAVLCAGFSMKVSASAKPEISIRNALKSTFYVTVSFADNRDATPTKPVKKTIKREKTVTLQQPQGKNFVMISLYKDSSYKNRMLQRSFNLNNPMLGNKRDITISGASDAPTLFVMDPVFWTDCRTKIR